MRIRLFNRTLFLANEVSKTYKNMDEKIGSFIFLDYLLDDSLETNILYPERDTILLGAIADSNN